MLGLKGVEFDVQDMRCQISRRGSESTGRMVKRDGWPGAQEHGRDLRQWPRSELLLVRA